MSTRSTESTYPETAANAAVVLLTVAHTLFDNQLAAQAAAFENEGGFTERLYRIRSEKRKNPYAPTVVFLARTNEPIA